MAILSITTNFTGEIGVEPRLIRIVTTDSGNTVITPNYLLPLINQGYDFKPTDMVHMVYDDGTIGIFKVIISGNTITLASINNQNDDDAEGLLVKYISNSGIIGPTTISPSDVVTYDSESPLVVGNLVQTAATNGVIEDAGVAVGDLQTKASIKADVGTYAGGAASFSFTATGVTTSSIVQASFKTQANPVSIETISAGTNLINVVASGNPGASTLYWTALAAAQ